MEQIIEPKTKYKNNYMYFMFYMIIWCQACIFINIGKYDAHKNIKSGADVRLHLQKAIWNSDRLYIFKYL